VHAPQLTGLPQLSVPGPQAFVPQSLLVTVQLHWPGPPPLALQVCDEGQVPQLIVPPHPSLTVPQLLVPHADAAVCGTQPQVPGPPVVLLQANGDVQLPQLTMPPQPSGALPQFAVPQACAGVCGTQGPETQEFTPASLPVQTVEPVQTPQLTVQPHPSGAMPQVLPRHACRTVRGKHSQVPQPVGGPLHELMVEHVPQLMVPPQPSDAVPQFWVPQAWACLSGWQTQFPRLPEQTNGGVQEPHDTWPPQPSGAAPHVLVPQAWAGVLAGQPQIPGPPPTPTRQTLGAVHVPHWMGGQLQPPDVDGKVTVPQLSPGGQAVGHSGRHWPAELQRLQVPVQVPQLITPPHPSDASPHTAVPHACAFVLGMHPHTPGPPSAPLQAVPASQTPHGIVPPQRSAAVPQVLPAQACAGVSGAQTHMPGVPPSVEQTELGLPQMPQLYVPPHPSAARPQSFVPHACDWEMRTHASGGSQASLISAYRKNVFAFERQSRSPHSRPT
jgi:hypothetical protein